MLLPNKLQFQWARRGAKSCKPANALQSPEMGYLGNTIFRTQEGTFGGAPLQVGAIYIYSMPPLLSKSLLKGELNIPGGLFKWLQAGPPKVPFWVPKMVFPRFPNSGLCRGSAGLQVKSPYLVDVSAPKKKYLAPPLQKFPNSTLPAPQPFPFLEPPPPVYGQNGVDLSFSSCFAC